MLTLNIELVSGVILILPKEREAGRDELNPSPLAALTPAA